MTSPVGNSREENRLTASSAGREAKIATAKAFVNKHLKTFKEKVIPTLTQVDVDTHPLILQRNVEKDVYDSTDRTQQSIQRAVDRSIESDHSYGNQNSFVSRTINWLLRR